MWQVQFLYVVEREREIQRELERRRQLADVVRTARRPGRARSLARRALTLGAGIVHLFAAAIDRPAIGSNHV